MQILFVIMILAYAAGALAALAGGRRAWGRELAAGGAAVGGAAGLALGLTALLQGGVWLLEVPALLPLGGGLALRLDGLSAVFLIVIGLGTVPAAIYSAGYTASYAADDRVSLRGLGALLNVFLLAMSLLVLADNVLTFLLMWEGMSLSSYFLVITEHDNAENVSAGRWYLGMAHVGLAALMVAFFLLMNGGMGAFADLRATAASLPAATRNLAFVLAFLGFGAKAGMIPLHVWLPRAHPAAPSHVSALMSGVMLKLGIYGLLRVGLDLLGGGPAWWGGIVLAAGALSAMLGRALCTDGARPEAAAGLFLGGEHRHHPDGGGARASSSTATG